jgi:hypothetical protein
MIKPRTSDPASDAARPTVPQPKTDRDFGGWGPRLRY